MNRKNRNGLVALLLLLAVPGIGLAQNGPAGKGKKNAKKNEKKVGVPGPEVADKGGEDAGSGSLLRMILDSGPTGMLFMAVLGLFSIVGASVAVERAFNLRRNRILPQEYVDELQRLGAQPAPQAAQFEALCSTSPSPISVIVAAGIERRDGTLTELEKAMEDTAAREFAELRARMRPLITVGAVAPLVGLLGTVVGMIIAFHTASQAGLGKAELLAKGIYMALITTAGGLGVAIPAMLLAAYFTGRVERLFREMDRLLAPLISCFVGLGDPNARRSATKRVPAAATTKTSNPIAATPAAPSRRPEPKKEPVPEPVIAAETEPPTSAVGAEEQESPQIDEQQTENRRPPKRTSSSNPIQI